MPSGFTIIVVPHGKIKDISAEVSRSIKLFSVYSSIIKQRISNSCTPLGKAGKNELTRERRKRAISAWDPSELGEDLTQSQEWAIIWAITKNYPL